jgi:hypothetical protein
MDKIEEIKKDIKECQEEIIDCMKKTAFEEIKIYTIQLRYLKGKLEGYKLALDDVLQEKYFSDFSEINIVRVDDIEKLKEIVEHGQN